MAIMITTIEKETEYNKIHSFQYDYNRFIIFDIFVKNGELYVIIPVYSNDFPNNDKLLLNSSQFTFTIKHKKCKINYEPIIVLIYDIVPVQNSILEYEYVNLNAKYDGLEHTYKLINYTSQPNKYYLTATTLFKDDYNLGQFFCNYYQNQGVEHFYLYYNGIVTVEITDFLHNRENITLLPWDFVYFNYDPKYYFENNYHHHAQPGQIHHALYKYGKNTSQYMIFCDFDEYIYIPKITLKAEIQNTKADAYTLFCYWSKTLDNSVPKEFPEKVEIGDKITNCRRKHIYNTQSVELIGIHEPHTFLIDNPIKLTDYMFFHFYNWSSPNRIENTHTIIDIDIPKI